MSALPDQTVKDIAKALVAFGAAVMNQKHAAAYIGVDRSTFWEIVGANPKAFPPVKLTDGKRGYRRKDLDRWVDDRTINSLQDAIRINDRRRKISGGLGLRTGAGATPLAQQLPRRPRTESRAATGLPGNGARMSRTADLDQA